MGVEHRLHLWPRGVIPYQIDASVPSPQKDQILAGINAWQAGAKIIFKERTAQIADYVEFAAVAQDICSSPVGRRGGRETVKLGPKCGLGNITHEIGHTIGLQHEQMRTDRPTYVSFFPQNVKEGYVRQFESYPSEFVNTLSYCEDSIMHYGEYAFSANGEKTLEALDHSTIGQRNHISACDISAVDGRYAREYGKR